jgi:TolB-like protein
VEGSVRSDGNRLRVSAGLIDAAHGGLLWSGVYAQTVDEMFAVQEEISEQIANKDRGTSDRQASVITVLQSL